VAKLGQVGVWLGSLSRLPFADERAAARALEDAGYGALWIGESHVTREAMTHAGLLLAASDRITVATGIASIFVRDASTAGNGATTLAEGYPGRFVLGLGVSHAPLVERRGHVYERPLETMRAYLDAMDRGGYRPPVEVEPVPRVLAALAPGMLRLAAERADGAHPYFSTPEHTALARETLGAGKLLAPEQSFVLADDAATAREHARAHLSLYLPMENYRRNWLRLGFTEDDLADGGSDRLVDGLVVCGDEEAIAARVRAHLNAGADHVAVQAVGPDPLAQLLRLAPVVLAL